ALALMSRGQIPIRPRQQGISRRELEGQFLKRGDGVIPLLALELANPRAIELLVVLVVLELELGMTPSDRKEQQRYRSASAKTLEHMAGATRRRGEGCAHAPVSSFRRRASMLR